MKLYKRGTFGSPPLDGWLEASPAEILAAARPHADLEAADQVLGAAQFLANPFARSTAKAIVDAALGGTDE